MNTPFYPIRKILCCSVFIAIFTALQPVRAQNSYPSSGDALIHGLKIGTGPGTYSYENTALGASALSSNTGGGFNVAVGYNTLFTNTTGSNNVAVGYSSLFNNIGSTLSLPNGASDNTAIGYRSLYANTYGQDNAALGTLALPNNTTGSFNVAGGSGAMEYNSTGNNNVGVGYLSMAYNTSGNTNTALGYQSLYVNTTGYSNIAVGAFTLQYSTSTSNLVAIGDSALMNATGPYNTAIGSKALLSNTTATYNTALGYQSLYTNTVGSGNIAAGPTAMYSNQSGTFNAAYGWNALYSNTTGGNNSATGIYTMYYNTTGSANSAYGLEALLNNTTGSYNTGVGELAGPTTGNLSNTTAIGYDAAPSASNSVVIGNTSVTSIGGQVQWTAFSDGRYKKNITQNVPGLAFINKLTPITYNLDVEGIEATRHKNARSPKGPNGITLPAAAEDPAMKQAMKEQSAVVYTGFVAQDVDKAAQSIGYRFSGVDRPKDDQQSFYGLRYSEFVVPLVRAVQELSAKNDSLEQANTQLSQRLDQIEQFLGISKSSNSSVLSLSSARLFQNVPNPFNQTTQINYFLPQNTGTALIQINGMNGETIKSIALSGTGAGQVSVQTGQLAAGTYTYSLIVDGNLIETKKMVLVK